MLAAPVVLFLALQSCDETIKPAAAALQEHQIERAASILNDARQNCSRSAWFWELLGIESSLSGDPAAAEDAFRKAVALAPESARLQAALGTVYLGNNKPLEARNTLEQAVALGNSDSKVLFALGTLEAQQGQFGKAVEYLHRIPQPDADAAVYFNLGLAYSHLKKVENARQSYFKAIDQQADHIEAYFHVGLDYSAAGEPGKAVAWLFRAHEMAEDRLDILYMLAEQLLRLDYLKTAEELVNGALLKSPQDWLLIAASGDIEQKKHNSDLAVSRYQAAISAQPDCVAGLVGLAQVSLAGGKDEEARGYLARALAIEPDNPSANAAMGVVDAHGGDWASAAIHLQKAWDRDQSNAATALELARALRSIGKLAAALRLLNEIAPALRDSSSLHTERSRIYARLHRDVEAQAERDAATALEAHAHDELRFEDAKVYVH